MEQNWSKNLSYEGTKLGKKGTTLFGWIVSANTGRPGTYQIRCPAIHGYCDINEQNCDEDVVAKASLPIAGTLKPDNGANTSIVNNGLRTYTKGEFVLVRFDADNYGDPVIVSAHKSTDSVFASKEQFAQSQPYIISALVEGYNETFSASQANSCVKVITAADKIPQNGKSSKNASKCGENGAISNSMGAFIGDFLKIVQDTDGKIGSKFVNSVSGELFSITGYVQKYLAAITGIVRGGIGWIKAIVTKTIRQGIDKLVKMIMTPIKGITQQINEVLEEVLASVFCSFGNIEGLLSNMIEDLLNNLADSAIGSVFGCLDSLVDGILNSILGEVLGLMNDIMGMFSSLMGVIGGFGDMLGEAINAILDFLGITCGGSGDCSTSASEALVSAFNSPGDFGLTAGLKRDLNSGLDSLTGVSNSIGQATADLNAQAAEYAKGVDLGTAKIPGTSTDNAALRNAFTLANNALVPEVANVFDFCNNLSQGNNPNGSGTIPTNPGVPDDDGTTPDGGNTPITPSTTTAVIIGPFDDKYDATYIMTPIGNVVDSGDKQKIKISRNVTKEKGIIIFAAHVKETDTARIAGVTGGINDTDGDLSVGKTISDDSYAFNPIPMVSPQMPIAGNVFQSQKIVFQPGERDKIVTIKTKKNEAPKNKKGEQQEFVTYHASIYRHVNDTDIKKFPYKNLPSTSEALHTRKLKIKFALDPTPDPDTTDIKKPPQIITKKVTYSVNSVSVDAGGNANFVVERSPYLFEETRVKCVTSDVTAIAGTHYKGGTAVLKFKPGIGSATFSVPTIADAALVNQTFDFNVTFTDDHLNKGMSSNLGGTGTSDKIGEGTSAGAGITKKGTISYSPVNKPSANCPSEILFPEQPVSCLVQEESTPIKIGFKAKTSVAGYTLSYQWQYTYTPDTESSWQDITTATRNESINELVTTFGPSDVTFTDSNTGQSVTLDGWDTAQVAQSATVTYAGFNTNELTINPVSYLICDEEYYRCKVTATPTTISSLTPTLEATTNNVYVGVTKDEVYLSTVNCAPPGTLTDGTNTQYPVTAPTPETPVAPSAGQCVEPSPEDPKPPVIPGDPPEPPDDPDDDPDDDPTDPPNPPGPPIKPTDPPEEPTKPPVVPVVVGKPGGVVTVPIPKVPPYKRPPLVAISGLGFGAIANAEIDDNGNLTDIVVIAQGTGYPSSEPEMCGILSNIIIQNAGGYYETSPTVYVNDDPTIAFAAVENGRVVEIRITNPKDIVYDDIPRIRIAAGGGFGAYARGVISYVPCDEVADRYLKVVNKYSQSKLGTISIVDCP